MHLVKCREGRVCAFTSTESRKRGDLHAHQKEQKSEVCVFTSTESIKGGARVHLRKSRIGSNQKSAEWYRFAASAGLRE